MSPEDDSRPPGPIFTAAILAGGRGTRLGGVDKNTLVVGAHSILDRQLALLAGLEPHILIVAGDVSRIPALELQRGHHRNAVQVIEDLVPRAGALGGLYSALVQAPTEQVLVLGCDMPFLTAPFLAYLIACGRDVEAAVPRDARGRHPLCATYARRTAPRIRARIDRQDLRVHAALDDLAVREIGPDELSPFDRDGRLLTNINTPDDYARARELARQAP